MKNVRIKQVLKEWYGVPFLYIISFVLHGFKIDVNSFISATIIGIPAYYITMYFMMRFVIPDYPELPEELE